MNSYAYAHLTGLPKTAECRKRVVIESGPTLGRVGIPGRRPRRFPGSSATGRTAANLAFNSYRLRPWFLLCALAAKLPDLAALVDYCDVRFVSIQDGSAARAGLGAIIRQERRRGSPLRTVKEHRIP